MYHAAFKGHEFDKEVGMRYRNIILAKGSSISERITMKEFVGTDLNDKYFVDSLRPEQETKRRRIESSDSDNVIESV
mgnify:FL=1